MVNSVFVIVVVLLSWGVTGFIRNYAQRNNLIDIPNDRSSHALPTPRGGGLAIVVMFLASSTLFWFQGLISIEFLFIMVGCGGAVAITGFVDDYRSLSAGIRLTIHLMAVVGTLVLLPAMPELPWLTGAIGLTGVGYVLVAVALIWLLNLYNFMDGIDGVASLETLFVAGGASLILYCNQAEGIYSFWLCILMASTIGFLVWNWPPAKIFMGDGGSGFLGFILGVFVLITSVENEINLWSWVILLASFITDSTITLLRRIIRKERFFQAHRSHAYQILSRRFCSHRKVTVGMLIINIVWLLPLAFLASRDSQNGAIYTVIAIAPLMILAIRVGAGTTNN